MEMEGANYYLKPMNCPFHNLVFRSRGRSYRELPLRLFEFGSVYRYEKSGVIHGLTRVRGMTQDDAHIYCTKEQMQGELKSLLNFVLGLLRDYGLDDFYLELSTRDDSPKFVGAVEEWEEATAALEEAARDSGLELVPDPGGAAFYGPKISVQARDAIGRTWQMSTIQVDFQLPQRFELEYQATDGTRQRPIMIHRALFGSIERFFGVLTEHYAGAFPAWLAPVQVIGIRSGPTTAPIYTTSWRGCARKASARRSTTPTSACRRRSARRSSRRSRSWRSPVTRTFRRPPYRSVTGTGRSGTTSRSKRQSRTWPRSCGRGRTRDRRMWTHESGYTLDSARERLDLPRIAYWLGETYWAKGRDPEVVKRSIENSLPYGLYAPSGEQAGFFAS
jgi:hypothetical protein